MERLEKRMYIFVPYQLSGRQIGIQAGHAALRYSLEYHLDFEFLDFAENWETWMVMNGGTTNSNIERLGTLNILFNELILNEIKCVGFHEPDLQDALTAVCFIADERVFNKDKYPDYIDSEFFDLGDTDGWEESIGNSKNILLRQILKGKRKA